MQINGQISSITQKTFANGGSAFYVVVDGKEYKVGTFAPRGFVEGDWVEFEADEKQNGRYTNRSVIPRTMRKSQGGAQRQAAPVVESKQGFAPAQGAAKKYEAFDERQEIISKQSSLNTSMAFISSCVAAGIFPFPANSKASAKVDLMKQWLLDEAGKNYKLTTGRDWNPSDSAVTADAPEEEQEEEVQQDESW